MNHKNISKGLKKRTACCCAKIERLFRPHLKMNFFWLFCRFFVHVVKFLNVNEFDIIDKVVNKI